MNIASVVISGESFDDANEKPVDQADERRDGEGQGQAEHKVWPVPCVASAKNERMTTTRPVSGPTERSMPPVIRTISCPKLTNASAAREQKHAAETRSLRNFVLTVVV